MKVRQVTIYTRVTNVGGATQHIMDRIIRGNRIIWGRQDNPGGRGTEEPGVSHF